jgi:uncharacterized iron-regulated membrane protein
MAHVIMTARTLSRAEALYRAVWRWHFYAGLFCVPFILVLALTGSMYLFKPQVEAWLERPYDHLALTGALATPEAQVNAALAAVPGARLKSYEVRADPRDAARVTLAGPQGEVRLYVHPQSLAILKAERPEARPMEVIKTIHGTLLMGTAGSVLVELAACWAIVMIATGLYLWWPRGASGPAGILYPRLHLRGRALWRDLHGVVGVWVSGLALFLLLSGLPWTTVWGGAFKDVREFAGDLRGEQDWSSGVAAHVHHGHAGRGAMIMPGALDAMVALVRPLKLAPPVLIAPPSDSWPRSPDWTARSDAQDRPRRTVLTLDPMTGAVLGRRGFADGRLLDRLVGYGVAAHEGQLFGPLNQALGVLTALMLAGLSLTGTVLWWRRRPRGTLGAPPAPPETLSLGLATLILALAILLPVLGASLVATATTEYFVLRRIKPVRKWLGLRDGLGVIGEE